MNYKKCKDGLGVGLPIIVLTTTDGNVKYIPSDPQNRDWIQYQEWLAAGNTPDPAD